MINDKFELILFDLDGTIIDSMEGIVNSINYAFRNMGIEEITSGDFLPFIGPPILYTLQMDFGFNEKDAKKAMEFYHECYKEKEWKNFRVYNNVPYLIENLNKKGKLIALATNKPQYYARDILELTGLDKYFNYIGGSNVEKGIINKKLVIQDCLRNINPDNNYKAIMIGDRHYDIEGANEANVLSMGITYGYGQRDELVKAGAYKVFDTPEEVLKFLT